MNPTILCGRMEMQALQLAYVSILLCLFLTVEKNSLPRRKAFQPYKSSCGTFSPRNNWLELIKRRSRKLTSECSMRVDWPNLCLGACVSVPGSGLEFFFLFLFFLSELHQASHARWRNITKGHMQKILHFHKCIQYMCGEDPRSLQLSALCCSLHIHHHTICHIHTSSVSKPTYKRKTRFIFIKPKI